MDLTRSDFPRDFVFGTATSSYQIEGHAYGGAGPTHWDTYAATPGNVVRAENGKRACDHYHRYEDDLDLAAVGFDAYRFSTSWARVLPEGRGTPNPAGLDFYDRLVDAMLARGLAPYATLYHWELPAALADLGGWQNPDIAHWFADFATVIMRRIGDRVHAVAPVNEPWCVAWLSHFLGAHAPGLRDVRAATRAMHHVLAAHGRAISAMRALGIRNLGAVVNLEYAQPGDESDAAKEAARVYDGIYNRWFLGALFHGEYPSDILQALSQYMPTGWQDDMPSIAQTVDWVGINYYTRNLVVPAASGVFGAFSHPRGPLSKTSMGWEIYPEGLCHFLQWAQREYTGDVPIFVTENGMSSADVLRAGRVTDSARIDYIEQHLRQVRRAISNGVPVAGYFAWSLLDNYEWSLGYDKRFGLVHVDFDTLERTPKDSYHALTKAIAR